MKAEEIERLEKISYHKGTIERLSEIIDRYSIRENNELHSALFDVKQSHALLLSALSKASEKEEENYQYKFTYKCSKGLMGVKLIDTKIKDNEEAIAKFENKYPDLVWRQIELISPPKN